MKVDENSTAELFYTSGSTGTPKGVMLSHRTVYLHAISVPPATSSPFDMVDLHTIPLFHANGWGHAHASTMMGVKQVMVRRFDPVTVYKLIRRASRNGHGSGTDDGECSPRGAGYQTPMIISSMRQIQVGGAASRLN